MTTDDMKRLLVLVATRDPRAADELDRLASRLHSLAESLRAGHNGGTESSGGIGDRVRMKLVGPDGSVRSDTDPSMN